MIDKVDQSVKLILIGGSGVGKSSLLTQFADNKFTENYLTTIGVDFRFKMIKEDGLTVKFQIWDTAGQERFRTITSSYYKGTQGILMVYDLTDKASVDDLENYWIPEVYNYCEKSTPVLLIGNKSDAERSMNSDRIKRLAEKYGYTPVEMSAKTGEKVHDTIKSFGMRIVRAKTGDRPPSWSTPAGKDDSKKQVEDDRKSAPVTISPSLNNGSGSGQGSSGTMQLKSTAKKGNVPGYKKQCC